MVVARWSSVKAFILYLSLGVVCALIFASSPQGRHPQAEGSDTGASPASKDDAASLPDYAALSARYFSEAAALKREGRRFDSLTYLRLASIYADSDETKARALFERGQAYYALMLYYEAATCFRIFLRKFPNAEGREAAHLALADALFRAGLLREAVDEYERAGTSAPALFGKANALQSIGRSEEARAVYVTALALDKDYLSGAQDTACLAAENARVVGRRDDAKALLDVVKDQPFNHRRDVILGRIAAEEGDHAAALAHCGAAKASPERETRRRALLCLGDAAARLGREQEGEAHLRELRREYACGKERDAGLLMLAKLHRSRGEVAEALPMLRELTFRPSPYRDALQEIEQLLLDAQGRDPSTTAELWKSVGRALLDRSRSPVLLQIAEMLRPAGRPFVELCRWIMNHGTDDAQTRCGLSLSDYYLAMRDPASAMSCLRNTKISGAGDDGLRLRARYDFLEGQQDGAVASLQRIRDLSKEDLSLLSMIAGGTEPKADVLALFHRAMKAGQWPPEIHLAYADLLHRAGRSSESIEHYRYATAAPPSGKGGDDDMQWGLYRIATLGHGEESEAALRNIRKEGQIGRLAELSHREARLNERIKEVH